MTHRNRFLLTTFVSTLGLISRQGGALGDPDPTKDWPKPEPRAGLSEPQIAAAIADYARRLHETGHFSGVVLAAKDGRVVGTSAFGLANAETKAANTIETKFNTGSITKMWTKVAIGQLAEAGKLSLDDTIQKHLPDLRVAGADTITIRQLLDHRSGLGDILGPRYEAAPPSRLRELRDFVPLFIDQPLGFEPGTSQRYSNAGYVVLGLIVERESGETYRAYVQNHILAPAHMTSSGFFAVDEPVANCAIGYTLHGEGRELTERVPNTRTLPGRPSSAGGAFATAPDLLRFYQALLGDKLLSPRWTSFLVNGSFDDAGRSPAIGVAGGAPGINAAIELGQGWTVIALSNFDPPSANAVARGAMELIRGPR